MFEICRLFIRGTVDDAPNPDVHKSDKEGVEQTKLKCAKKGDLNFRVPWINNANNVMCLYI